MLKLYVLGSFLLKVEEQPIRLPTRKVESLLTSLVLHREVHNRERIASMFWGDSPDELARRSLRTALSSLWATTFVSLATPNRRRKEREDKDWSHGYLYQLPLGHNGARGFNRVRHPIYARESWDRNSQRSRIGLQAVSQSRTRIT